MSDIDRAGYIMGDYEATNDLDREGLLAPDPQIIRTIETAHGTHADSIIMSEDGAVGHGREACEADLPAVVVRDGAGARACREALEGETT